jgi:hypothetical protein
MQPFLFPKLKCKLRKGKPNTTLVQFKTWDVQLLMMAEALDTLHQFPRKTLQRDRIKPPPNAASTQNTLHPNIFHHTSYETIQL